MGRCITIITLTGATSLGLLTGSLTYQSFQAIPELIRKLNQQTSLKAASAEPVLAAIRTNFTVANTVNIILTSLSTWAFSTSYRYSSATGKHPFLVYSAVGAPIALVALFYQAGTRACALTGPFSGDYDVAQVIQAKFEQWAQKFYALKQSKSIKEEQKTEASNPVVEDALLESSYIHVSDESSDSSPETPVEATESATSAIEGEIEDAMSKKQRVNDLEIVGSAYNVASVVAGVSFAICSIGVIGDQFFL